MLSSRSLRALAGLVLGVLVAVVAASAGTSATSQTPKIVIWADADRVPAVTQVANAWASSKGVTVQVVQKQSGPIRQEVSTVAVENAPDVIVGAHDWVGELSGNGSIVPLSPSAATRKQFPAYALNAFSYGTAIKKLYGAPVALENIALITNTKLAKVPKTFADLERQALAAKKKTKSQVGLAVQQGQGDAYHMYPFFSGLGGYVFGTNKAGNLDPSDIGVANPKFLKNAPLIDKWNKESLIRSQVNESIAKDLFLKGKVAYCITGPWFLADIRKSGVPYAVSVVPDRSFPGSSPCRSSASGLHGHEVRVGPRGREPRQGSRRELHDAARGADDARTRERPVAGEPEGARPGQGQGPEGVRRCLGRRSADAQHPADGERVAGPRRCVGALDEGRGIDPRPEVVHRRQEEHRAEDRLIESEREGAAKEPRPLSTGGLDHR